MVRRPTLRYILGGNEATEDSAWILTWTKKRFYFARPEDYTFSVAEIAYVLAQEPRWGGHVDAHMSVAWHSILVANAVFDELWDGDDTAIDLPRSVARAALLHDASEAFLRDIPAPLKRMPEMAGYRAVEKRVQGAIVQAFDLDVVASTYGQIIKHHDELVTERERAELRPDADWGRPYGRMSKTWIAPPSLAVIQENRFLEAWAHYGGEA
jgi:hypothetical protein